MSTTDLFLSAFGGKEPEKDVASNSKSVSPDERERLFADAFRSESKAAPTPHLGQNWRVNNVKARGLSFGELYELGELRDVPYRDLPDWVRDGGYAEPSADEKRHQKQQFAETGLTQSERNEVFDAFAAQIEALADMSERETLRDSAALDHELASTIKRWGQEQVMEALKDEFPKAAQYFAAKLQVQAAEAKAAAVKNAEQAKEQKVAEEIRAAQEAIAAMDAKAASDLKQIPADVLQQELTRRAAPRPARGLIRSEPFQDIRHQSRAWAERQRCGRAVPLQGLNPCQCSRKPPPHRQRRGQHQVCQGPDGLANPLRSGRDRRRLRIRGGVQNSHRDGWRG